MKMYEGTGKIQGLVRDEEEVQVWRNTLKSNEVQEEGGREGA